MRVGVVGGGLTGLTAALDLVRRGHQVTVWEKSPALGGQVRTVSIGDAQLEGFYHHMFASDKALIGLITELGLSSSLQWLPSLVGYYYGGRVHDFTTPVDLMRFSPLGLFDRVRVGMMSLYLRRRNDWRYFETITAEEWLLKKMGRRSYEVIWGPLLRGKFGDSAERISMAWLWGRLHMRLGSRRGGGGERLGYLKGGFGRLIEALGQKVRDKGGSIMTGTSIKRIAVQDRHVAGAISGNGEVFPQDAIIATAPSPTFLGLIPELPREYGELLQQTQYLAALCLILVIKRPFGRVYWLNVGDRSFPFVAVIEQTNFVSPAEYGGKYILYVSNYVPASSPLCAMKPDGLVSHYLPFLQKINPRFDSDWVEQYHVFKEEYAQPIVPMNYSRLIPDMATPIGGLYLANTTQIYPEDRGMNQAVQLGLRVAGLAG
ncbi:MAG: NAD(P)/FAD-dependent oxidoreductase [Chloroflexi bacterium]|nr:NAD(P)/FAD-dependent oxidoreductase [Chloroflexota bacterium]